MRKKPLWFPQFSYDGGSDKTNPKMYRKALEILKVRPDEADMTGDNIQVDILLPKRLGIRTIFLDTEGQNLKCQAANAVVNNLPEASEVILGFPDRLINNKKEKNVRNFAVSKVAESPLSPWSTRHECLYAQRRAGPTSAL